MTKALPRIDPTAPASTVTFVRRIQGGRYEHGHVLLGLTRDKDKYVRTGVVGTYEAAANASQFEPAVSHITYSAGAPHEDFHSRNQGHHNENNRS